METIIENIRFNNGLTVQLKPTHTAPLISHWVWYRVGSRDEVPGKTGISHWVEHMQFKGTSRFPMGSLDKAISRDGGVWNALTYMDWTTYFETVPSEHIELSLDLESDRMVNSYFDPDEVESERFVVISEREGNENEPLFRLDEAIQQAAFDEHAYRHEVIGEKKDLHSIQREDLYHHYRSNYVPNNAVVAVAGDFNIDEMVGLLRKYYEDIPMGVDLPRQTKPEGVLKSERRIEIEGPGETTFLQISYRAPAADHADFFSLTLLDSLLTGPAGLNMFGGGISNKTSRLYKSLVDRGLATGVRGGLQATIDPFLYEIAITVHPDHQPEEVLAAFDAEVSRLQDTRVTEKEIARANKQARALFAYSSENITNQAFWLGFSEMFASYDWFTNYVESLEKVTAEDIRDIAQAYLEPSRRVTGTYIPVETDGHTESDEGE